MTVEETVEELENRLRELETKLKETASRTRGTRLSPEWTPSPALVTWAREFTQGRIDLDLEIEKFRDYWVAKGGVNACKLDWDRTFRNWVRNNMQWKRANGTPSYLLDKIRAKG